MRVTISTNGRHPSILTESGDDLARIATSAKILINSTGAHAVVELAAVSIERVDASAVVMVMGKAVRRIEYADGTSEDFA